MLLPRHLGRDPRLAAADALRALSGLDWTGAAGAPALLAYAPVARGNPYQALLYDALPRRGIRPVPTFDVDTTLEVARAVAGGPALALHLHWLNLVTAKARTEEQADEMAQRFLAKLQELQERGTRILWTVHNVLPHDSRYPQVESALRGDVARIAERVHVMSPRTRELVAPWFDLPEEKLLSIPHPSYDGVYPDHVSRGLARQELGISPAVTVHVVVGVLKPYKGLDELTEAFDTLCSREPGRHVLVVAGMPDTAEETRRFVRWATTHPDVVAAFRRIPVEDMQVYLRAADLSVVPYRRSLNSGALALTQTFGLPTVLSGTSGEVANLDPAIAEIYDPDVPEALAAAMRVAAVRLRSEDARAAVRAAADLVTPARIAPRFAAAIRAWLDSEPAAYGKPAARRAVPAAGNP